MATVIIGVISYVAGLLSGYAVSCVYKPKENRKNNEIVLIVVTAVWALSMFVDIASPTYETSPLVHGLMGAIVGFFYKPNNNDKTR